MVVVYHVGVESKIASAAAGLCWEVFALPVTDDGHTTVAIGLHAVTEVSLEQHNVNNVTRLGQSNVNNVITGTIKCQ